MGGVVNIKERYRLFGAPHIEGWLHPDCAQMIDIFDDLQKEAGLQGDIAEIGVHHGRLFVLLALCARPGEAIVAIDLFELQHLNQDGNGFAERSVLDGNITRWCGSTDRITYLKGSTLELSVERLRAAGGPFRLFSVDGGHSAECALNDLVLADQTLAEGGVMMMDDVFNPHWPDVATGCVQYMLRPDRRLQPFAVHANKVHFCHPGWAAFYREGLLRSPLKMLRSTTMWGVEVDLYDRVTGAGGLATYAASRLRASRLYPHLVRIKRALG